MQDQDNKQPQPLGMEPPVRPTAPDTIQPPSQGTPNLVPAWFSEQSASGMPQPGVPKSKKKGRIIGLVIAIVVVIFGAGSVLAYNFWYQNPEKVVTDSLMHAIKAKSIAYAGSVVGSGSQDMKIEVTGRTENGSNEFNVKLTFKSDDKDTVIDGSALMDSKGDLYLKLKDLDKHAAAYNNAYMPGGSDEAKRLIDGIAAKINDRWVKVSAQDISSFSASTARSQKCLGEAATKIQNDESITSELADTYKKHKFIVIDDSLGSQNGSLGYVLSTDKTAGKAFVKELKNTKLYKSMRECDKTFEIDEEQLYKESGSASKADTKVELWVSRWTHQITKLRLENSENKEKQTVVFEPVFNQVIDPIKTPSDSITIKQLQADLTALFEEAMSPTTDYEPNLFDEGTGSEL